MGRIALNEIDLFLCVVFNEIETTGGQHYKIFLFLFVRLGAKVGRITLNEIDLFLC